jgi:hypothetical protein
LQFLEAGLAGGERCLWIHRGDSSLDRIRRLIIHFSPLASRFAGTDAFAVVPFQDWYFPSGSKLDARSLLDRWSLQAHMTTPAGFSGLRVFAEMDVTNGRDLNEILDYEEQVSEELHKLDVIVACLCPSRGMPADALKRLRGSHDFAVSTPGAPVTLLHDDQEKGGAA